MYVMQTGEIFKVNILIIRFQFLFRRNSISKKNGLIVYIFVCWLYLFVS